MFLARWAKDLDEQMYEFYLYEIMSHHTRYTLQRNELCWYGVRAA